MALITHWIDSAGGIPPNNVGTWQFDTDNDSITLTLSDAPPGTVGAFHPPVGTLIHYLCEDGGLIQWFSTGEAFTINRVTTENHPSCCELSLSSFSIARTNNTDLLTPNGKIIITSSLTISDYEASIDDGDTWVTQVDSAITFEDLPAGTYTVRIREISGVCSVMSSVIISDNITYPPLIISPAPSVDTKVYSPVFHPITVGYELDNNQATVKSDVNGTYLEVDTDDARDYLATLPIIKIIDNEDYEGTYQVTEVDDVDTPTKFYFEATYTTEQEILFVPFERQVFHLFAEKNTFNDYQKIADISIYPNADGIYAMRVEGFLQSVFKIIPPVNNGDELTLLRKYYVMPKDFDVSVPALIYNALYSAIPDLTNFLSDLIPLGPAPINFINEQTQKGYPVLFSYIDTATGRIKNVTSSYQTDVVSASPLVYIPALPLNIYDVTWVNPGGSISDLQVDPDLPEWITIDSPTPDTIHIHIDTSIATEGGDYDGSDYDGEDYLTNGVNTIVGCYQYDFTDGASPLFTLQLCVYPIQKSNQLCVSDPINIAWVNRQGGWSSYIFDGRRDFRKEIGASKTYKSGLELKTSSIEDVYDSVEVNIVNKNIKDLIFISSLRQSIQAYLWSDATLQWSIPIVIDKKSFPVYTKPFKQIDVEDRFTFRYAEEIVIQTQ